MDKYVIKLHPKKMVVFLSIFLITNSTVLFGTNLNHSFVIASYIYLVISSLYLLIKIRKHHSNRWILGTLMVLMIITSSFWNRDFALSNYTVILLIINAILLTEYLTLYEFAKLYNQILMFLTISSLIFSLIVLVSKSTLNLLPSLYNSGGVAYGNAIIFIYDRTTRGIYRNYSLFREPGVYQFYLSLGIFFEIFVLREKSVKRIVFLFIAIATTLSTSGYIALAVYAVYILFSRNNLKRWKKIMFSLMLGLGLGYLIMFTNVLDSGSEGYSIFGKISKIKLIGNYMEIGGASVARIASLVIDPYIALLSPIWGVGISRLMDEYVILSQRLYGVVLTYNTESIFIHFARFGILYWIPWVYGYVKMCKKCTSGIFEMIIAGVSVFVMLATESYVYNVIIYVLMMYGLFDESIHQEYGNYDLVNK